MPITPSSDTDDFLIRLNQSEKKVIIVPNSSEFPGYFEKAGALRQNGITSVDDEQWREIFIVRPIHLKQGHKFPNELKNLTNIDAWTRKAVGSMSVFFQLVEKREYARLFHERIMQLEAARDGQPDDGTNNLDDRVLHTQHRLEDAYEALWKDCTPQEKMVLNDFAQDEYANYRNEYVINKLIRKGMLVYQYGSLHIMTMSFRNFVLEKSGTVELLEIQKGMTKTEKMDVFRMSLFVAVIAVALFVFFTQEEVFKQISAAMASLVALTSMLFKFMEQSKPAAKV